MDEQMFEEKSRPIIENILKAHVTKNYEQLTNLFCENSNVHIPKKEEFNEAVAVVIQPLGNVISFTYLGSVDKKCENLLLWKILTGSSEIKVEINYFNNQKGLS